MIPPRAPARAARRLALGALLLAVPARAQTPGAEGPVAPGTESATGLAGFGAAAAAEQRAFEEALRAAVEPDSLRRWSRGLAAQPHVAGGPGQRATRDSVVRWMREAGLEVGYDSLVLYLPYPRRVRLARVLPTPLEFALAEPPLPGDPTSGANPVPVFHAYSGSGTVEAPVIYANYGMPEDYRVLDSLGVQVRGHVVVARYGRAFRGIKAREAERRGAAGLLLFNDPAADGAARGPELPDGPMRPARGVQRGSVYNGDGDPSTPRGPSVPEAPRVDEERMEGIARIPVLPIGAGAAEELLGPLAGPALPEEWQGGLASLAGTGPGPVTVRLEVEMERGPEAFRAAFNTIGAIRGSEWPEEWVLMGAHRDAWGPGAVDNVSGTASVVAAARAFGVAAAAGWRPRRTVVFATWDAEEWGIIGSTEWVEANAARLRESAVAYLNQDGVVSGPRFGAAAAPELAGLVRDATTAVPAPAGTGTVAEAWRREAADDDPEAEEPPVRQLGGGSDHKAFYLGLGVPAAGFGFGGPGGVYHSMYDGSTWMERFGDPGYLRHAATARLAVTLLARLAGADVLPFAHDDLAAWVAGELDRVGPDVEAALRLAGAIGGPAPGAADAPDPLPAEDDAARAVRESLAAAREAVASFGREAGAFAVTRDRRLRFARPDPETARRVNESLLAVGRELAPPGAPTALGTRNLLVASDPDNGYASLALPEVRLALRRGDPAGAAAALRDLERALRAAADRLAEAAARLGPAPPAGRPGGASPETPGAASRP
ncbi:MAG: M20/M25/M40 family metallo-hydrolase [Gemmatimonadota bacterium]|nr:M20/M25/M40 family metallo-hydrolase [Gemmatimonadota bacterium]